MLQLFQLLRSLDAKLVAAVTGQDPPTEKEARLAAVLGTVGLVAALFAAVLLPAHGVLQTVVVAVGLFCAVPYLHALFERVLVSARGGASA